MTTNNEEGNYKIKTYKYTTRVTQITVLPEGEPVFSEMATKITIVDEAAGEYVEISQNFMIPDLKPETISISSKEWPYVQEAVNRLLQK